MGMVISDGWGGVRSPLPPMCAQLSHMNPNTSSQVGYDISVLEGEIGTQRSDVTGTHGADLGQHRAPDSRLFLPHLPVP